MRDPFLKKSNNTKNQKKPMIKQKKEDVTLTVDTNIPMITSSSSTSLSSSSSTPTSYQPQNYTELKVNEDSEQKRVRLYKTELCRNWEERNTCRYGDKCKYAHGKEDLRSVERHPKYKTEWCHTFETTGTCPYGVRCTFLHSTNQENHSNSAFSNLIKNHSTPNLNEKRSSVISDISFNNTILSQQQQQQQQQQQRRYSLPYYSSFLPITPSSSSSSSSTSNAPTPPPPTSTLLNNQRSSSVSSSNSALSCSNNSVTFSSNHFLTTKGDMDLFFSTSPPVSLIPQNLIEDINGPITPSLSIPSNESISCPISYFSNGYSYLPTTFSN